MSYPYAEKAALDAMYGALENPCTDMVVATPQAMTPVNNTSSVIELAKKFRDTNDPKKLLELLSTLGGKPYSQLKLPFGENVQIANIKLHDKTAGTSSFVRFLVNIEDIPKFHGYRFFVNAVYSVCTCGRKTLTGCEMLPVPGEATVCSLDPFCMFCQSTVIRDVNPNEDGTRKVAFLGTMCDIDFEGAKLSRGMHSPDTLTKFVQEIITVGKKEKKKESKGFRNVLSYI